MNELWRLPRRVAFILLMLFALILGVTVVLCIQVKHLAFLPVGAEAEHEASFRLTVFSIVFVGISAFSILSGLSWALIRMTKKFRAAEEALRESQAKALLLLDSAAEGIFGTDLSGICTFVNRAGLEILGYSDSSELVGKEVHSIIHHHTAEGSFYPTEKCRGAGVGIVSSTVHVEDEVFWNADQNPFPVEYWTRPLFRDNFLVGAVTTFVNITERKATEVRKELLYRSAQDTIRAREDFLSNASHEIKTPLTSLFLQLQFLRHILERHIVSTAEGTASLCSKVLQGIKTCEQQSSTMARMIDDLLDLTRIRSGKIHLTQKLTDLDKVMQTVVAGLQPQLEHSGSRTFIECPQPVVGCWDPARIQQVMANLITNAIKYGQGKPIEIVIFQSENEATFSVKDHGMGMTKEQITKLFKRFERSETVRHISGLGLGLFIAHGIVSAHGGRIEVESTPGLGSKFTVILPIQKPL
ncbi:PAS domain-containing sensor histidine kinase [Bdellovibrionota bacterium FG-2]